MSPFCIIFLDSNCEEAHIIFHPNKKKTKKKRETLSCDVQTPAFISTSPQRCGTGERRAAGITPSPLARERRGEGEGGVRGGRGSGGTRCSRSCKQTEQTAACCARHKLQTCARLARQRFSCCHVRTAKHITKKKNNLHLFFFCSLTGSCQACEGDFLFL